MPPKYLGPMSSGASGETVTDCFSVDQVLKNLPSFPSGASVLWARVSFSLKSKLLQAQKWPCIREI